MPRINNIQLRRGTYAQWDAQSAEVLASGEPGFVTDFDKLKIGDGVTQWSDLTAINDVQTTIVHNATGSPISALSVVYINGGQGDKPTITKSIASTEAGSAKTYGIVARDIPIGGDGLVVTKGLLKRVNTLAQFDGVTEGTTLYLSPTVAGGITTTKPHAPNHMVGVGKLIRVHQTQGVISVDIQNGFELDELHDVAVTGVTNNQYLIYNSGTQLWTPTSSGIFKNVICESLTINPSDPLTPSVFKIRTGNTDTFKLTRLGDQNLAQIDLNITNLQFNGMSGVGLPRYPSISFNSSLSAIDYNRTPIKLSAADNSGGSGGENWPTVSGIIFQVSNSGIYFLDRMWKATGSDGYDPQNGIAYTALNKIVSEPSLITAGLSKLSFYIQTSSGVVNSSTPSNSIERLSIDSEGNTIINGKIIANDGELDHLTISEGGLNVNGGIIQVNNSFGNNFNMTINSSGINILTNYEFITDHIDTISTPIQLLQSTSLDPNQVKVFLNNQTLEVGDTVLFRGFTTSTVSNGIYIIASGTLPNRIKFIRHPNYTNGTILQNGDIFGVEYDGSSYILNDSLTIGQNVTIGTNSLNFTKYEGVPAVTFSSNKDAEFSSAVYAKEKYFRIKHPDPDSSYQYLQYGSLESPYHGVRLTGESELKKGVAKIPLPKYLKHLIHKTDINIQLTNNGHHKILYVDSVNLDKDHFIVKGYRSKTGGPFRFYWSFTGVRKDVDPLVPEQ